MCSLVPCNLKTIIIFISSRLVEDNKASLLYVRFLRDEKIERILILPNL